MLRSRRRNGRLGFSDDRRRGGRWRLFALVLAPAALMVLPPAGAQAIVAGHIEGKVTALSGGAAVPGIEVCADSTVEYECAETNSEGKYAIELLEGSYTVSFENENCLGSTCFSADYLPQYYKDAVNYLRS